jgi:hypothetical protein
MDSCPYCDAQLFDELNFCMNCEKQVRCLNQSCGSVLYKDKERCLKCGEPLKSLTPPQQQMNTLFIEEEITKTYSKRKIEVKGTDVAVTALLPHSPIGQITPLKLHASQEAKTINMRALSGPSNGAPLSLPGASPTQEAIQSGSPEVGQSTLTPQHIFSENDQHGFVANKKFRDYLKSLPVKKTRMQAFAVMFVWAHIKNFETGASRDNLTSAIKNEGLHDSNPTRNNQYTAEVEKSYFKTSNNLLELNYDGEDFVETILKAVQDYTPNSADSEAKAAPKRGRGAGKPSESELKKVKPWVEAPLDGLEFDVRRLSSATDWAAFGLYLIITKLGAEKAVEAGHLYVFLKEKYVNIPHKRKRFVESMRTSNRFIQGAGGTYSLTEATEKEIETLIGSSNKQ